MTSSPCPLGDAPELTSILEFLSSIGLRVAAQSALGETVLPAMTVRDGRLLFDPDATGYVGDLLHDAGHLAVTDPALRDTLPAVGNDPAEEMAAMAWSYAAAVAIGLPVATLFHDRYKGGGEAMQHAYAGGGGPGVPMLWYWGMAARPDEAAPQFPAMKAWLRPA